MLNQALCRNPQPCGETNSNRTCGFVPPQLVLGREKNHRNAHILFRLTLKKLVESAPHPLYPLSSFIAASTVAPPPLGLMYS